MNGEKELEVAEAELAEARHELVEAEHKVEAADEKIEAAEEKIEEIIDRDRPFEVEIIYNGLPKKFEVRHDELVKTLVAKAIDKFGPIPQPHLLGLFKGGKELGDAKTLEQEEVKPGDKLLLRPSEVRGGA